MDYALYINYEIGYFKCYYIQINKKVPSQMKRLIFQIIHILLNV